jgi:hypothetical protein
VQVSVCRVRRPQVYLYVGKQLIGDDEVDVGIAVEAKPRDPTGRTIPGCELVCNKLLGAVPAEERALTGGKRPLTDGEELLTGLGFAPSFWLPVELANCWRTTIYPKHATPEAIACWQELWEAVTVRACRGVTDPVAKVAKFKERRRILTNDLKLIRQHRPDLLPAAGARSQKHDGRAERNGFTNAGTGAGAAGREVHSSDGEARQVG